MGRELEDKLIKIPESEMIEYHEARMKKFRYYYIGIVIFAVLCVVFFILGDVWMWIGMAIAIVDFFLTSYVTYRRKKWIRIFENMIYIKRKREKTIASKEKFTQKHGNKYDRIKKYQNKKKE